MAGKRKISAKKESTRKAFAPLSGPRGSRVFTSTAFKPGKDAEQVVRSIFEPSSSSAPYPQKVQAKQKQKLILDEINGHCFSDPHMGMSPDSTLLDEFFPESDYEFRTSELVDRWSPLAGWNGWPDGSLHRVAERDIAECVVKLLNDIIRDLGYDNNRVAVDRQNFPIPTHDGGKLKPDVFLWGRGSPAFPYMEEKPSSKSVALKKRPYQECDRDDNADYQPNEPAPETPPAVRWPWCVVPIEIKTNRERGGDRNSDSFVQLGTYAREVLTAQPGRRFVPSLLLTELTAEFVLWDHAGVVISERVHYHNPGEHELFYRILVSFVTWNDVELGFDPTVFYHGTPIDQNLHIVTKQQVTKEGEETTAELTIEEQAEYVVQETMFRSYNIRSRGSRCWRVRKLGGDDTQYLVFDSWVEGGAAAEHEILLAIGRANPETGMASLVHIDDVRFPINSAHTEELYRDSVNGNRIGRRFHLDVDLIHTRTVMRCHGTPVPLGQFETPRELVGTLLDIVKGHQQIYSIGRIVHRDLVPWNILIQRNARNKTRGILIDFSCATSVLQGKVVPRPTKTPSSSYFMCIKAMIGEQSGDSYLDELQSIYWILCLLISIRKDEKDSSRLVLSDKLESVMGHRTDVAMAEAKSTHFYAPFRLDVPPSFGPHIEQLARNLHDFFNQHFDKPTDSETHETVQNNYRMVIDYFTQAYEALAPAPTPKEKGTGSA